MLSSEPQTFHRWDTLTMLTKRMTDDYNSREEAEEES